MNPANRTAKKDIEQWLKPILEKENLKDYVIKITGNSAKGDNFLGDVTFVEVSGKTESNEPKEYNFVIKCGKKSDELRKIMPIRTAFENEIYFYKKVLPVLQKFQAEKNLEKPFNKTAKCYDSFISESMEVLILEDMRKKDYALHDKTKPMSEEHVRLMMKSYGKLHAISYALRDQKPEVFKKIAQGLTDVLTIMVDESKETEPKTFDDIINIAQAKREFDVVEKTRGILANKKSFKELADPTDPYSVILHGDCWNNNFLFRYEGDQRKNPADVCFLDFQISRLGSPVLDLSYYLFTSISKDDLSKFDEFVQVYYESLADSVRKMGSDPEKVLPFKVLEKQWKDFAIFGLIMMPAIARICLSGKDEVNDLAEVSEAGRTMTEAFTYTVKNIEEYEKRTLPIMKMAIDRGFI